MKIMKCSQIDIRTFLAFFWLFVMAVSCGVSKESTKNSNRNDRARAIYKELNFSALELIGTEFDIVEIKSFAEKNEAIEPHVYNWKNHYVFFGKSTELEYLKKQLLFKYPKAQLKFYDKPIYNFNRIERCKDSQMAVELEHVLLTANLIDDPKLQKEYVEFHNTQFEKWPEVSEGFCNADFQQLLVFKNQRQLIVVISIPKGKSLDELNPRTTENNPKVKEWNTLMQKYQTGINGTNSEEIWVFLEKIVK